MSQEIKKESPSPSQPKKKVVKTVRKLKKNYIEFGNKGDIVTPAMEKALKAKNIPVSAVAG